MGRSFVPRFLRWLVLEVFLDYVLALPGLLILRGVTLGRWPTRPADGAAGERSWFSASVVVGALLWACATTALAAMLLRRGR